MCRWRCGRNQDSFEYWLYFQKCIDFHCHLCPGLALGYQAAQAGMKWLAAQRAEDEMESKLELVEGEWVCRGCLAGLLYGWKARRTKI
jgi:formylmethanofuran dehydrogenase subunit E